MTGGGNGVGRRDLRSRSARAGGEVWVNDIYDERAARVVGEIEQDGGQRAYRSKADVTSPRQDRRDASSETGPVDILVNNAGIPHGGLRR